MRAVIQRVSSASVTVADQIVGQVAQGVMILLGVEQGDVEQDAKYLADKTAGLRIFADEDDKMNKSIIDIGGEALVVSQFTLLGDVRKGRRPSFIKAAGPEEGKRLYLCFIEYLKQHPLTVATGQFQADMQVALVNDGPITILLDSKKLF